MSEPLERPFRWLVPGLLVLGLLGSGCSRVPCKPLCHRVRECRAEVTRALVDRLPTKSKFARYVRQQLPERVVARVVKSCPERCAALRRYEAWRKVLRACDKKKSCEAFARCIAPALEP